MYIVDTCFAKWPDIWKNQNTVVKQSQIYVKILVNLEKDWIVIFLPV